MDPRRLAAGDGVADLRRLSIRGDAPRHGPAASAAVEPLPDIVMEPGDYPAALRAARLVAALAQRRYFAFVLLQLGTAFLGALLASIGAAVDSATAAQWCRQASAAALLVGFVVLLVGRVLRTDV